MKKIIWLIVFCFALSLNAFAQAKEITENEYLTASREAFEKFRATASRRVKSKTVYYKDGKLSSSIETITENINSDKFRFVVIEISDKKNDKSDFIQIGENKYCRKNDGAWKNSQSSCSMGWITGLSDVLSSQFFVETVKKNGKSFQLYRSYYLSKGTDSAGKEIIFYDENKFWVSDDGRPFRRESETGLKDTKEIRSQGLTTYEYDPKDLKIEAPIKP